jgi:hypothetical protein
MFVLQTGAVPDIIWREDDGSVALHVDKLKTGPVLAKHIQGIRYKFFIRNFSATETQTSPECPTIGRSGTWRHGVDPQVCHESHLLPPTTSSVTDLQHRLASSMLHHRVESAGVPFTFYLIVC